MARYIAKNLVAAGYADKIEVGLSYAIGVSEPTSIMVTTFGTAKVSDDKIISAIRKTFPLTPKGIINYLNLRRPIYALTTNYGHFGKDYLPWEQLDKVEELKKMLF
ncbi:MAG: methionine adenosyltransferase domain-containing protein, partial [Bacilli bacterium]|nr:methionine adenosyltransferase domain-containing protein [Bacilli bacterium]